MSRNSFVCNNSDCISKNVSADLNISIHVTAVFFFLPEKGGGGGGGGGINGRSLYSVPSLKCYLFFYLAQPPPPFVPYPIGVKFYPGYTRLNISSRGISQAESFNYLSITAV